MRTRWTKNFHYPQQYHRGVQHAAGLQLEVVCRVAVAFVVLIFATSWFVKTELQDNYNASAAVYQKVADLEKLLTTEQKPEKEKELTRCACPTPHVRTIRIAHPFTVFSRVWGVF